MGTARWKANGKAFLENSSMHGLRYIAEDQRTTTERFMWVMIFVIGVCASCYLCLIMWIKYDASPAVMSVETTNQPLSDVEFPAVTICSQNKISKRKLDLVMKNPRFNNFTVDDLMFTMRVMIKIDSAFNRTEQLTRLHQMATTNGISTAELVNTSLQTMVTCEDMLTYCIWKNQPIPCDQLFDLRPTDDGLCCGFNHLEPAWSNNPKNRLVKLKELRRVILPGIRNGLTVFINTDLEDVGASTAKSNGFKLLVHNARDFPDVSERGFSISPGFETFAGLEPFSSYTSPDVEDLPIGKRGCINNSENPLKFYANYSSSRCMMECLTRKMIDQCSCYPFYYTADVRDRVCHVGDYVCLSKVNTEFRLNGSPDDCSCLPNCDGFWIHCQLSLGSFPDERFATSTTSTELMRKRSEIPAGQYQQYMRNNMAVLNVFYREHVGMLYRTDLRYGIEDFISAMGGALGLGFGVSFLSIIELLYFLVVRYYFNLKVDQSRSSERL